MLSLLIFILLCKIFLVVENLFARGNHKYIYNIYIYVYGIFALSTTVLLIFGASKYSTFLPLHILKIRQGCKNYKNNTYRELNTNLWFPGEWFIRKPFYSRPLLIIWFHYSRDTAAAKTTAALYSVVNKIPTRQQCAPASTPIPNQTISTIMQTKIRYCQSILNIQYAVVIIHAISIIILCCVLKALVLSRRYEFSSCRMLCLILLLLCNPNNVKLM